MNIIIILVGLLIGIRLFGIFPFVIGFLLHSVIQYTGTVAFASFIGILLALLFIVLSCIHRSLWQAIGNMSQLSALVVGVILSIFSRGIFRLGYFAPVNQLIGRLVARYPGEGFAEKLREDAVQRRAEYIEQTDCEINRTSQELTDEARRICDLVNRRMANGEGAFAIALAVFSIVTWVSSRLTLPSEVGAVLSFVLVITVLLHLTILNFLMYRNPASDEEIHRLVAIVEWNQATANANVLKAIPMFRILWAISDQAYNFYLDWVLRETHNGEEVNRTKVVLKLRKPLRAFVKAEIEDITPSEASIEVYGKDVFTTPEFVHLGYSDIPETEISLSSKMNNPN